MARPKKTYSDRDIAINANAVHIAKQAKQIGRTDIASDEAIIYDISVWCLRTLGMGRVSLQAYLDWREKQKRIRMYYKNVKRWKRTQQAVFKRDNYTCTYCGKRGVVFELDHIVPFSKGGSDELDNLTTARQRCNRQKRDKTVEEFKKWREEYERK